MLYLAIGMEPRGNRRLNGFNFYIILYSYICTKTILKYRHFVSCIFFNFIEYLKYYELNKHG